MITLIIILALLLMLNTFFVFRRIIAVNKLHALYESLENEVIKQRLTPDKKLVTFLRIIKTPIALNHQLDIFKVYKALDEIKDDKKYKKTKTSFVDYIKSLPHEVQDIVIEIQRKQDLVINLSLFKPLNLMFILCIGSIGLIGSVFYKIFKAFGIILRTLISIPIKIKEVYEYENIIIASKYKLQR